MYYILLSVCSPAGAGSWGSGLLDEGCRVGKNQGGNNRNNNVDSGCLERMQASPVDIYTTKALQLHCLT